MMVSFNEGIKSKILGSFAEVKPLGLLDVFTSQTRVTIYRAAF